MLLSTLRSLINPLLAICFATSAIANDAFIYYSSTGTGAEYSRLKSHLEGLGFTVSGSTSTTVSSTDISGQDLVIDIAGTSNCGSTCRSDYDSYVSAGGKLIIAAPAGATNRQNSIETLIESKMSVGTMTYTTSTCSTDLCYSSTAMGDYATASQDTLTEAGQLFQATGGTVMASNTSTSNWHTWYKWDYGPNGGIVIVAMGYDQFQTGLTYTANMTVFLTATMEEEGLYSASVAAATPVYGPSGPTAEQMSRMEAKRSLAAGGQGNTVEATITGNDNDIHITQAGGPSYIDLIIIGNTNDVESTQNMSSGGMAYNETTIIGDTNDVDLIQQGSGDKAAFIEITGDSNTASVIQKDSGSHYVNLEITGDDHVASILQEGSGDKSANVVLDGTQPWNFDLEQSGSSEQNYTLPHSMSDGSAVSGTCSAIGGCNLTVVQQ